MTTLVTGGAGFIGSHLSEKLLKEGYKVICLDNFANNYDPAIKKNNIKKALQNDNYTLIKGDILDKEKLEEVFEKYEINKIVHLAALAGVRTSLKNPQEYIDVDIKGTVNLLEKAQQHNIENFVFASSSSVYGDNKKTPFKETHNTNNQVSPYAAAKKCAEIYCHTYHKLYNIPISVLRFFTVYGPRQRPEMAIHKFTRRIMNNESVPMFGDGSSERDYTYISDIVNGILLSLKNPSPFEIFNLGNSKKIKLKNLIKLIEEKTNKKANIKKLPFQKGDVSVTYADISKSKKILGYEPKVSIEEGIEKFVDWYKKKF